MDFCSLLIIVGAVAQGAGFGITLYEIAITQRRELPEYVPVHHRLLRWGRARSGLVVAWVRRRFGRLPEPQVVHVHAVDSASSSETAGEVTVLRTPPAASHLEARVNHLEAKIADLTKKQVADVKALTGRIAGGQQRATKTETELRTAVNELEAKLKEALRESLLWEKIGIGLFIVGLLISTWGSLCSA